MKTKDNLSKTLTQAIGEQSNNYDALQKEYTQITGSSLVLDPNSPPPRVASAKKLTASVVIPAWNVESTIIACLSAIEQSSFNHHYQNRLEVVVVDDGSTDGTWEVLKNAKFSLNLKVVRQNHQSIAHARNTDISIAKGDIIVSCDADMILSYYTIEHFVARHQQFPNILLVGFRSNTDAKDPRVKSEFIRQNGSHIDTYFTGDDRITFSIPGWPSNMCLASDHLKKLGYWRNLNMPNNDNWYLPDLVFGALFSVSKKTYYSVGGYDERFYGWGCEDGYFAAKAIAAGHFIIPIYAASGLHIYHLDRSENKQKEYLRNRALYLRLIRTTKVNHYPDWLSKAESRIVKSFSHKPNQTYAGFLKEKNVKKENISRINDIDNLLAIGEYSRVLDALTNKENDYIDNDKYVRQVKALIGMNKYQEAINILKDHSKFSHLEPEQTIDLIIAHAAKGQFLSAKILLKNLSEAHPEIPELSYWYNQSIQKYIKQGIKYYNQGFKSVALRCFEVALINKPDNRIALEYREKCLSEL